MDGIDPGLLALVKENGGSDQWNNPLFWIIILGFLKGENGILGGGSNAAEGATQAKLDCLQQGQQDAAASAHNANMTNQFHTSEVNTCNSFNRLSAQLAECCCGLQAGQKDIVNEICVQTQTLVTSGTANTQRIIDNANAHANAETQQKLIDCKTELSNSQQTKELLAALANSNSGHPRGSSK